MAVSQTIVYIAEMIPETSGQPAVLAAAVLPGHAVAQANQALKQVISHSKRRSALESRETTKAAQSLYAEVLRTLGGRRETALYVVESSRYTPAKKNIMTALLARLIKADYTGRIEMRVNAAMPRSARLGNLFRKAGLPVSLEAIQPDYILKGVELLPFLSAAGLSRLSGYPEVRNVEIYQAMQELKGQERGYVIKEFASPEAAASGLLDFVTSRKWSLDALQEIRQALDAGLELSLLQKKIRPGFSGARIRELLGSELSGRSFDRQAFLEENFDEALLHLSRLQMAANYIAALLLEAGRLAPGDVQREEVQQELVNKAELFLQRSAALHTSFLQSEKSGRPEKEDHSQETAWFYVRQTGSYWVAIGQRASAWQAFEKGLGERILSQLFVRPQEKDLSWNHFNRKQMDFYRSLLELAEKLDLRIARAASPEELLEQLEAYPRVRLLHLPEDGRALKKAMLETNTLFFLHEQEEDHGLQLADALGESLALREREGSRFGKDERPGREAFASRFLKLKGPEKETGQHVPPYFRRNTPLLPAERESLADPALSITLSHRIADAYQNRLPVRRVNEVLEAPQEAWQRQRRLRRLLLSYLYPSRIQRFLNARLDQLRPGASFAAYDLYSDPRLSLSRMELIADYADRGLDVSRMSRALSAGYSLTRMRTVLEELAAEEEKRIAVPEEEALLVPDYAFLFEDRATWQQVQTQMLEMLVRRVVNTQIAEDREGEAFGVTREQIEAHVPVLEASARARLQDPRLFFETKAVRSLFEQLLQL